jgi:tetratricopeptide (TPR) repeat protein
MTSIALRSYNRLIEELITNGRYEQAIAHCRHIIQTFPKYAHAYRNLGRAYIESGQYQAAADIFLRLLSSDPDDEVAHLGLSIVREELGQLSQAIWHLEHVFELFPANPTVQVELLRLLKRRDGKEPARIPLGRGALARMYVKGGLNQQAVAELRAGLAEDSSRLDWQILLADLLRAAGYMLEAVEISQAVLQKLPYGYKTNLLMLQHSITSGDKEGAVPYRQKLVALDPYLAFISPEQPEVENVSDQAVSLSILENIKTF